MEDRAGGPFQLRPAIRGELRAPVAGFLKEVHFDEGDRVSPGAVVARLEIPDLASRIAQKRAEVGEAQAKLKLLEIGPRPEEMAVQRERVERMKDWRNLAQKDLANAQQALKEELVRLDKQIEQFVAEVEAAREVCERAKQLQSKGALAEEQHRECERKLQVAQAQLGQAQSQKRHREALKTREAIAGLDAEAELARREKDLGDAEATLNLLEAGSRPEQIEAERACLARLEEEARYLEGLQEKVLLVSPVPGMITTPRLKEKVGEYVREGESILVVEEPEDLEAEIALAEQEVARVRAGQAVQLKPRALPFESFAAKVDRIAPTAGKGEVQSSLTVYCRLESTGAELRPGMTGYARVYTGRRPIGAIGLERAMHFLRPEFWWW
jgi:multidrug efflux pump subunit AcrA (membrane-fusion protein)